MSSNAPTPRLFTASELHKWLERRNLKTKLQPTIEHELPLDRQTLERLPPGPALRNLLEGRQADIIPALRAQWAGIESAAVVLETGEVRPFGRFEDLLRIYLANPMFPVLDSWSSEELEKA